MPNDSEGGAQNVLLCYYNKSNTVIVWLKQQVQQLGGREEVKLTQQLSARIERIKRRQVTHLDLVFLFR